MGWAILDQVGVGEVRRDGVVSVKPLLRVAVKFSGRHKDGELRETMTVMTGLEPWLCVIDDLMIVHHYCLPYSAGHEAPSGV